MVKFRVNERSSNRAGSSLINSSTNTSKVTNIVEERMCTKYPAESVSDSPYTCAVVFVLVAYANVFVFICNNLTVVLTIAL